MMTTMTMVTMTTITMTMTLMLMLMVAGRTEAVPAPGRLPPVDHHHHGPLKEIIVTVNVTRYGSNLCHECTTTVTPCAVQKTRPCVFNNEGEVLVANTTDTGDDDDDDDDVWTFTSSDGKTGEGRKKRDADRDHRRRRRRKHHRRKYGRKWRKWHNERSGSSSESKDSSSESKEHKDHLPAMCRYNVTKRCWEKRCEMKCCDGSAMDSQTNGCRDTEDGGLVESCLNGGTLLKDKSHCQCPQGFSGLRCQNRECSVKCQNGGLCQTRNDWNSGNLEHATHNDDYCVCPADTTGKFCEDKVCNLQCKNNGTCKTRKYSIWGRNYCKCKKGFHGNLCERGGVRAGQCPRRSAMRDCNPRRWLFRCHEDNECAGIKKCCFNACHQRLCVYPDTNNNATCRHGNETYPLGTAFKPDPCHLCTCNASHVGAPQGVVECAHMRCPEMPQHCSHVVTPPGQCCPVCQEEPDVAICAGNYTYPHFTNCPQRMVEVEVDGGDTKMATVRDLGLEARDCQGQPLEVVYSEDRLAAGKGEDNFRLLTATSARDGRDNFAQCAFHVQITDPYPPTFVRCPADVTVARAGRVTWEVPVAEDNVGLAQPPTSSRSPGLKLPRGQYLIEYFAEDFQGNEAVCKFLITVGHPTNGTKPHHPGGRPHGHHHDHPHPHPHHQQQQHQHLQSSPSHTSTAVGVSAACCLLVLVLLGLAAFFWRRHRSPLPPTPPPATPGSQEGRWTLHAASGSSAAGGVPPYSLGPEETVSAYPPPAYHHRVDHMIAGLSAASGGQQSEAGELPSKTSLA